MKSTLTATALALAFAHAAAQSVIPLGSGATAESQGLKKWEAGLQLGAANYQGDLTQGTFFNLKETQLAGGAFVRRRLGAQVAVRGSALFGVLSGDDSNYDDRNARGFSFKTPFEEFSAQVEWEPLGLRRTQNLFDQWHFEPFVSPYLFVGLGFVHFQPRTDYSWHLHEPAMVALIQKDADRNKNQFGATCPIGAGLKLDIDRNWMIGVEGGLRAPFSDYLDGVSHSANPDKKDWYVFGGLTLTRRFWGGGDRDRDGVPDAADRCPDSPGARAANGCPEEIKVTDEERAQLAEATYGVQFETGKSKLKPESFPVLDKVAAIMLKYPAYGLRIEGHTDDVGETAFNQTLSESRAIACLDYLITKGVPDQRMRNTGFGELRPIVPNDTAENRAKNRRVEFILFVP